VAAMKDPMGFLLAAARGNPVLMAAARQVDIRLLAAEMDADRLAASLRSAQELIHAQEFTGGVVTDSIREYVDTHADLVAHARALALRSTDE
jgi:hypothetical protein